ncbi:hypothetical protein M422DRAFT_266717 [Sphaerobolus stellatus SS14]|uniref:Uncharacterized protein n=1 Tax=Sphaerobolus stellatus (strain SS14) TaxID=990650 RepID=A0A0C9V1X9_SPHS4|nr:hypothetical protein M422DRAFT_266717 [Sphaerobolus stellatus SS14]
MARTKNNYMRTGGKRPIRKQQDTPEMESTGAESDPAKKLFEGLPWSSSPDHPPKPFLDDDDVRTHHLWRKLGPKVEAMKARLEEARAEVRRLEEKLLDAIKEMGELFDDMPGLCQPHRPGRLSEESDMQNGWHRHSAEHAFSQGIPDGYGGSQEPEQAESNNGGELCPEEGMVSSDGELIPFPLSQTDA